MHHPFVMHVKLFSWFRPSKIERIVQEQWISPSSEDAEPLSHAAVKTHPKCFI